MECLTVGTTEVLRLGLPKSVVCRTKEQREGEVRVCNRGREGEGASAQLGAENGEGTTHLEHQNQCQEKLVERGEARRRTEAAHDFLRGDRKGRHSLYIGYTSVIHRSTSGRTRGWHATSTALGHDASA